MTASSQLRALVTGGASGLGKALTAELLGRGAKVVVSDINEPALEAVLAEFGGEKAGVFGTRCDVADREAVHALVDDTATKLGGIDLIANNAGVGVSGQFETIPQEDWNWIMDINLWGVIYGCQATVPHMKSQGRGYIVNVASAAGLLSPPKMSAYNVTKAAVVALSETLYGELKPNHINVSVLCPTFFRTGIAEAGRGGDDPKERAWLIRQMERSKVQAPDVAKAAIDGVLAGELYIQPMRDGRLAWRTKRLAPQFFYNRMSQIAMRQF